MPSARSTREDGPASGAEAPGAKPAEAPPSSLRSAQRRLPQRSRPDIPPRHPLVLPLAGLYAVAMFAWLLLRFRHFGAPAYELGAYHSLLWNIADRGTPWNS